MSTVTRDADGEPVVTIYFNPKCGTARTTLGLIRDAGFEPEIIEYLKHPPGRERLVALMTKAGLTAAELVRSRDTLYAELDLGRPGVTDETLIDAMAAHPILMNRPIVVTARGVRLCRPADTVMQLLPEVQSK
jgi:arsenate reductase (glutaredoxin)